MFEDVGKKLQFIAKIVTWIGIALSIISGMVVIVNAIDNNQGGLALVGLLFMGVGSLVSWLSSLVFYAYGEIVDNAVQNIPRVYPMLSVEGYVVMPNHVHILVGIRVDENGRPLVAPTMSRVIKQLKGLVSKRIGSSIWQKSFHDHIIRSSEDYEKHLLYIYENPMRWCFDELYGEE